MARYTEMLLVDAAEAIRAFFGGDEDAASAFYTVAAHLSDLDETLCFRMNDRIIGMAHPNGRFRFYLVCTHGVHYIKYKPMGEKVIFTPDDVDKYFSLNEAVIRYFDEVGEDSRPQRQPDAGEDEQQAVYDTWKVIQKRIEDSLCLADTDLAWEEGERAFSTLLTVLEEFILKGPRPLNGRKIRVFRSRILVSPPSETTELLGEEFGVSKQTICNDEKRVVNIFVKHLGQGIKKASLPYCGRVQSLLEEMPSAAMLPLLATAMRHHKLLGDGLLTLCGAPSVQPMLKERLQFLCGIVDPRRRLTDAEKTAFFPLMRDAALYYYSEFKYNESAWEASSFLTSIGLEGANVTRHGIGYHDKTLYRFVNFMTWQKGYDVGLLEKAGLCVPKKSGKYQDTMRSSVIFPLVGTDGRVLCFDHYDLGSGVMTLALDNELFHRGEQLYSLNLATKTAGDSVIVTMSHRDYFCAVRRGFDNTVAALSPRITEAQMALLTVRFRKILFVVPDRVDISRPLRYCEENGLLYAVCDRVSLTGNGEDIRAILTGWNDT